MALPLSLSMVDETAGLRARQPKQYEPSLMDLSQSQIAQDEAWRNDLNRRHLTSLAQIQAEEQLRPDPKEQELKDRERSLALERSQPASLADLDATGLPKGITQGEAIKLAPAQQEAEKDRQARLELGKMASETDVNVAGTVARERRRSEVGEQYNYAMRRLESMKKDLSDEEYASLSDQLAEAYRRQLDALDRPTGR